MKHDRLVNSAPTARVFFSNQKLLDILGWVTIVFCIFYSFSTFTFIRTSLGTNFWLDTLTGTLCLFLCGFTCLSKTLPLKRGRKTWLILCSCILLTSVGNIFWVLGITNGTETLGYIANLIFIAARILLFTTIFLVAKTRSEKMPASYWIDGITLGFILCSLVSIFLSPVFVKDFNSESTYITYLITGPGLDAVQIISSTFIIAMFGWRPPKGIWYLTIGQIFISMADMILIAEIEKSGYHLGTFPDALWTVAFLLMAWAPGQKDNRFGINVPSLLIYTIPTLSTVLAISVLIYGNFSQGIQRPAVLLAALSILAALARLIFTFREMRFASQNRRQARIDELTGLPNRLGFIDYISLHLKDKNKTSGALILLDLDGFKDINDSLGHQAGDQLLKMVGPRLADLLRPDDMLARLSGDEYAIFLEKTTAQTASLVAERLQKRLKNPFTISGVTLHVTASIGISLSPDHGENTEVLLRRADIAMYTAKSSNEKIFIFSSASDDEGRARLQLINDLRNAIDSEKQLVLHYQPKIHLPSMSIIGVEALVRWQHPTKGLLYPPQFLNYVEKTGLMQPLTIQVLKTALQQCALWRKNGFDISVAVNLSASSVTDKTIPRLVQDMLSEANVPAESLELEITEEFLMTDRAKATEVLREIRETGVKISVDDFGTGYSSLAYLRELPIDILKLDRSFIFPVPDDMMACKLVESTVQLAHSLNLEMVAEGVETVEALHLLAQYGCDYGQGFYMSKPKAGNILTEWFSSCDYTIPGVQTLSELKAS